MPPFGPIKRRDLVASLRRLGFEGPFSGGRDDFMVKRDLVLTVPNPHRGDMSRQLLSLLLRQAGITRAQWEMV
jgi:hypothetical protein